MVAKKKQIQYTPEELIEIALSDKNVATLIQILSHLAQNRANCKLVIS